MLKLFDPQFKQVPGGVARQQAGLEQGNVVWTSNSLTIYLSLSCQVLIFLIQSYQLPFMAVRQDICT